SPPPRSTSRRCSRLLRRWRAGARRSAAIPRPSRGSAGTRIASRGTPAARTGGGAATTRTGHRGAPAVQAVAGRAGWAARSAARAPAAARARAGGTTAASERDRLDGADRGAYVVGGPNTKDAMLPNEPNGKYAVPRRSWRFRPDSGADAFVEFEHPSG